SEEKPRAVQRVADDARKGGSERYVKAHHSHYDERDPRHQNGLEEADVEGVAELADLEEAYGDGHREHQEARDDDPEVVGQDLCAHVPLPAVWFFGTPRMKVP